MRNIDDLRQSNTELELELELAVKNRIDSENTSFTIQQLEAEIQTAIDDRQKYQDLVQTLQNDHQQYESKLKKETAGLLDEVGWTSSIIFPTNSL